MKNIKKALFAFFVSTLTALNLVLPAYAEETDAQAVTAGFSVNVVGDGTVTVSDGSDTHSLSNGDTYNTSYDEGTQIKISSKANDNSVIDDVTLNNSTITGFKSGKSSFSFAYISKTADANFVISFKESETKSSKTTSNLVVVKNDSDSSETQNSSDNNENTGSEEEYIEQHKDQLAEDGITIDFNIWDKSDETKQIMKDYSNNIYKKYKKQRKAKAKESGLDKYCDSDYFLEDSFYFNYDGYMLNYDNLMILDKYSIPDFSNDDGTSKSTELNVADDASQVSTQANEVTVISWQDYTWNYMPGGYYNEAIYGLSNGVSAFCGQALKAGIRKGQTLRAPERINNTALAKVLYYGYGGHGDILTSKYGTSAAVCMTTDMASKAFSGQSAGDASGAWSLSGLNTIYSQIQSYSLPAGVQVYKCINDEYGTNWQGTYTNRQVAVYSMWMPLGNLQIHKSSGNTAITDNNNCYSLEGAVYGVYTSQNDAKNDTNRIIKLSTDNKGWTTTYPLNAGTYYIKELTPPKGYALNSNVEKVTITAEQTTKFETSDMPQNDPISVLLGKVDKETNANKPQGSASLAGAEFTVKYYAGQYDSDPANAGQTPVRQWVLRTNSNGFAGLRSEDKVSGDDFYYASNGNTTLPLGTITIQETKAPEGYFINNEVFVRKITSDGNTEGVKTYNQPTVKEQVIRLHLTKTQYNSNVKIDGAVFRHTKPNGTTEDLTTQNGEITITGLESGTHKIKEIYVPDGYTVSDKECVFNVASGTGKITFTSNKEDENALNFYTADNDGYIAYGDKVSDFSLRVYKTNQFDKALKGAEFTLYSDVECKNVVDTQTSNDDGIINFKNLKDRTHYYLVETKAPTGYRIPVDENGKAYVHDIYTESTPQNNTFDFTVDAMKYGTDKTTGNVRLEGTKADRVVAVEITNKTGQLLPETGSNGTLVLVLVGCALVGMAMYESKKHKKEQK